MIVKFDSTKAHQKYHDRLGRRLPNYSTIAALLAKMALVKWSNGLGLKGIDYDSYMTTVSRIGKLVHAYIEADLMGDELDTSEFAPKEMAYAENCLIKYLEWKSQHVITEVLCETQLVSEVHRFGGTIDIIAKIDGVLTLCDIKTSDAIYPDQEMQAATYRLLAEENGYPIEQVLILRFGKDERLDFEAHRVHNCSLHQKIFLHLLDIYNLQKEGRRGWADESN